MAGQTPAKKVSDRQRISVAPEVWEAVEAVARMQRVHPSTVVERALRTYLDPADVIAQAAKLSRDMSVTVAEMRDELRLIADTIAGAMPAEFDVNDGETLA